MKRKDKLKMMSIVMNFFGVTTFVMQWFTTASKDEIIDTDELTELGAGVCNILGLKTVLDLRDEEESE